VGVYFDYLFYFYFFSGPFCWFIIKTLWNLPSSSKNHIFYIFFHCHVKSYIYIYIILHLYCFTKFALNYINIYIFTGTLTFTRSVSPQTIYTHNTGFDQSLCRGQPLDWLGSLTKIWDLPLAPALGGSIIMLNSHPRALPYI
jgi:hypothetical protein